MRGRNPEGFGQSLSPRGKWIVGVIGVGVLVIFAAVGLWSGLHRGSYDQSRNGCINLSLVSSTGGAVIHACGGQGPHDLPDRLRPHRQPVPAHPGPVQARGDRPRPDGVSLAG